MHGPLCLPARRMRPAAALLLLAAQNNMKVELGPPHNWGHALPAACSHAQPLAKAQASPPSEASLQRRLQTTKAMPGCRYASAPTRTATTSGKNSNRQHPMLGQAWHDLGAS
jgi:hypothetical protein